jgi:hypothetical protein
MNPWLHGIGHTGAVIEDLVSVQLVIASPPGLLFDLVCDPALHPLIDGSGTVRAARSGNPERLQLGSTFSMDMRIVLGYRIVNTVVEFEEGHLIAWQHFYGHRWRYIFEPADGSTLVTEQWDARPSHGRLPLALLGFPARNRTGMQMSLVRLAELAAAREP